MSGGGGSNLEAAIQAAEMFAVLAEKAAQPGRSRAAYIAQACLDTASLHFDAARGAKIVKAAEAGDELAVTAVHHAIVWYIDNKVDIPGRLRDYLVDLLRFKGGGPKRRGQKAHANYLRDGLIRTAVRAVESHGFAPTRNPATPSPSACSIVKEVFARHGMARSEKTIEAIALQERPAAENQKPLPKRKRFLDGRREQKRRKPKNV